MAKSTIAVEDCLKQVDNRYQLILIASKRAGALHNGLPSLIDEDQDAQNFHDSDRPAIVAMKEIASGKIPHGSVEEYDLWEEKVRDKILFEGTNHSQQQSINSLIPVRRSDDD